jgi:hypothetical protein
MPRFITSGALGTMRSSYTPIHRYGSIVYSYPIQKQNEFIESNYTTKSDEIIEPPTLSINKQTAIFLDTISRKLLELSQTVEATIEDIKANCKEKPKNLNNHILASIDTPNMNITVGAEYILYVQKYGPPVLGKFDPEKLAIMREELGITQ